MQLQRYSTVPLCIGHLEEVDLGNRTGDVEQSVNATERGKRLVNDFLCRGGIGQVKLNNQGLGADSLDGRCGLVKLGPIARNQGDCSEVAREADGGSEADTLTGPGNDGYWFGHIHLFVSWVDMP
jgi:hypothetical protein